MSVRALTIHFLALAAALVVIAHPAEGRACTATEEAWVAAAARDTGLQLTAEVCSPAVVVLEIGLAGGPPLTVEVAAPPGSAFRMAGGLRVSPVAEISDWSAVPAPTRAAFDALTGWLDANAEQTGLTRPDQAPTDTPTAPGELPPASVPWLPLLALALVAPTLRRPPTRDLVAAAALLALAWGLRAGFGLSLPLHANGQGALWIRAAYDNPTLVATYGPGYPELYGWLARIFDDRPDLAVFRANALISALLPLATYALGLALSLDRPRALLAAFAIAIDPVGVRTGATEAYLIPLAVLAAFASLAACRAVTATLTGAGGPRRRLVVAGLRAVAAGVLAAQAIRIHPAALATVAIVPMAVLAAALATGEPTRRALRAALAVIVVAVASSALLGLAWLARSVELAAGAAETAIRSIADHPFELAVLGIGTALLGLAVPRARPRGVAVAGVVALALAVTADMAYSHTQLFQAAADQLLAPMIALGVAAFLAPRREVPWALAAASLLVPLLLLDHHWAPLRTLNTEQREYAWLADQLADLPPGCRLAHPRRIGTRVLEIPDYVTPDHRPAVGLTTAAAMHRLAAGNRCVVWAHTSICTPDEGRRVCHDVERALPMTPIASITLPAIKSFWQLYDQQTVVVQLLRFDQRDVLDPTTSGPPGSR